MKRWAFFAAVAAALVMAGCGGNGDNDDNAGGGGNVGGPTRSSVNATLLNRPGRLQVTYNGGQGRVEGSPTMVVQRVALEDLVGLAETSLRSELRVQLDGYTSQSIELPVEFGGFSAPISSRSFTTFNLDVAAMLVENASGGLVRFDGVGGQPIVAEAFTSAIRTFPGRTTNLEIFVDDVTLNVDQGAAVFDRQRFEDLNLDGGVLRAHLSDYITFDITGVASKPQLLDSSAATHVHFTGDAIALSATPAAGGAAFEVLADGDRFEGLIAAPVGSIGAPGTYTLKQLDPRDLDNVAQITSLQGIWMPFTDPDPTRSLILNPGSFEMIAFPSSEENGVQTFVMLQRSGSQITRLYWGSLNLNNLTWQAWDVSQLGTTDTSNSISGSLSALEYRAGVTTPGTRDVIGGSFTRTLGTSPMPSSGRFLVLRV